MGSKPSLTYCVPHTPSSSPFETSSYLHPLNSSSLFQTSLPCSPPIETLQDLYIHSSHKFSSKNFIGSRNSDGFYYFRTYSEIFELVNSLGMAIIKLNLSSKTIDEFHDIELETIGIFSKNREEWILADLACMVNNIVLIPFLETVSSSNFSYVLEQTGLTSIFCSYKTLEFILQQTDLKNLETIVCFDIIDKNTQNRIKARNLDYCDFNDLLQYPASAVYKLPKIKPSSVYTISYTSGTGFEPRGVIITHRNIISALINGQFSELLLTSDDVYLSYLPLAHIFERYMVNLMMANGCTVGLYNGEILKLKLDIADLKPTVFASVPKLFNKIFNSMNDKISQLSGLKKFLFDKALNSKKQGFLAGKGEKNYFLDKFFFNNIQKEFGSFKWMLCAAAPINPSTLLNLKLFCSCPIFEAYGLTECTGAAFITSHDDIRPGSLKTGFNIEFKIRSELDYSIDFTDKDGLNRPRGELLIRGPSVSMGYFKNQEECEENYEGNGWLKTGDICELDRKDGSLWVIDRKKDLFKLAFGEYMSPAKIEKVYLECKSIREIMVHGEAIEEFIVGIVVVNKEWVKENMGINEGIERILNGKVRKKILEEMEEVAKEGGLSECEKVRKIWVIEEGFEKLGVLTATFKMKRFEVKKMFAEVIKELYKK